MSSQRDTLTLLDAALERLNKEQEVDFWTVLDGSTPVPSKDKSLRQNAFGRFGRFGRSEGRDSIPVTHDVHAHDRPDRFDEDEVAGHKNLLSGTVQTVQTVQKPEKVDDNQTVRFGRLGERTVQNRSRTVQKEAESALAELIAGLEGVQDLPSEWLEGVFRLCRMSRTADVPASRWQLLQERAVDFCRAWGPTAHALGWRALDLFGCHRLKPYYRLDASGLVWLLADREIVAMAPDSATLRTPTGARLTYRCRRDPVLDRQRVLAWELPQEACRDAQAPAPAEGAS